MIWLILAFLICGQVLSFNNKNTLVLLDSWSIRETHSLFFKSLKDRGHSITFKLADDPLLQILEFGSYLYGNIILFSPSVREFGGKIDVKSLLDFVDDGGNVLVAANDQIGEAIHKFATECGVEFDEEKTALYDHWNYDINDDGKHNLLIIDHNNLIPLKIMIGETNAPLLFRGIGMSNDLENPLLLNVLSGSKTVFSSSLQNEFISDFPLVIGSASKIITALQTRNNARVLFSGSIEFFSDEFFTSPVQNSLTGLKYETSGNSALSDSITRWVFQESGVLRFSNVTHKKLSVVPGFESTDLNDNSFYTIMDETEYSIIVEELVDADPMGLSHKWVPYIANDIQLEFIRIDPFVRIAMKHVKEGLYKIKFKIPDVYGVYKFVVDYNNAGYSRLFSSTQITVRPLRHTQYERFIQMANPYYISAFSMMFGVFVFSFVFLHYEPKTKRD